MLVGACRSPTGGLACGRDVVACRQIMAWRITPSADNASCHVIYVFEADMGGSLPKAVKKMAAVERGKSALIVKKVCVCVRVAACCVPNRGDAHDTLRLHAGASKEAPVTPSGRSSRQYSDSGCSSGGGGSCKQLTWCRRCCLRSRHTRVTAMKNVESSSC